MFYVQKTIFTVMEYAPYTMDEHLIDPKKGVVLKDEHIKNLVMQTLSALEYLHDT